MSRLHPLKRALDQALIKASFLRRVLRPVYYGMQKARYGELVRPNATLKDSHQGGRLFVLCTGPGIEEIDFSRLRGQAVLGLGFLVKHRRFDELDVTFYADLEPLQNLSSRQVLNDILCPPDGVVIDAHNAEAVIADLFSAHSECGDPSILRQAPRLFYEMIDRRCRNPQTRFFLNAASKGFFERRGLFKNRPVSWIMKAAPSVALAPQQSHDLAWAPTFLDGASYFAVAAGIYMGFKEIVLVGAGYTYSPIQEFHFYDIPIASLEYSEREAQAVLDRLAHSRGVRLHSIERVQKGYRPVFVTDRAIDMRHRLLKEFADRHGVTIYNLVPEGFTSPLYAPVTRAIVENEWLTTAARELPNVY